MKTTGGSWSGGVAVVVVRTAHTLLMDSVSDACLRRSANIRFDRPALLEQLELRTLLSAAVSFSSPTFTPVADAIGTMAVGDINGDGRPDVLITQNSGQGYNVRTPSISVLLGNADGTFSQGVTIPYAAQDLALADFAGDGKDDLLTINANQVDAFANNGDGTFRLEQTLAVPGATTGYSQIAVADLSPGGPLDVVAVTSGGTVSIAVGNSNGTFSAPVSIANVGAYCNTLTFADVNGDGRPDLILSNAGGNDPSPKIDVLLNTGDDTFASPVTFAARDPLDVAVADINGDGHPDLIVADGASGNIAVLYGNGNGTFAPEQVIPTPYALGTVDSVAVGDFNGDGIPDLVAGSTDRSVVLQNEGDGAFTVSDSFNSYDKLNPYSSGFGTLDVVDLNSDGRPDVLLTTIANPSIGGTSNVHPSIEGASGPGTIGIVGEIFNTSSSPAVTIFSTPSGNDLRITGTPGNDTISLFNASPGNIAVYESGVGVDVFPSTGLSEIAILGGAGNDSITLDASLTTSASIININGGAGNDTILALDATPHDIHGAGGLNSVVGGSGNDTLSGGNVFAPSPTGPGDYVGSTVLGGGGEDSITGGAFSLLDGQKGSDTIDATGGLATLHGGNGNDLLRSAAAQYGDSLTGGGGNNTLSSTTAQDSLVGGLGSNLTVPDIALNTPLTFSISFLGPEHLVLADVNGDGIPDIVETSGSESVDLTYVDVLLGNGDGTFKPPISYQVGNDFDRITAIAVADLTGDGNPDIIVGDDREGLLLLKGNGDGTFSPAVTLGIPFGYARDFVVADVNGDGIPDIVESVSVGASYSLAGVECEAEVFLGNGNGTFQSPKIIPTHYGDTTATRVSVGDVNGDGKPDIVVAADIGNQVEQVAVLLGNGNGTFSGQAAANGATPEYFVYTDADLASISIADLNGDGGDDIVLNNSNYELAPPEATVEVLQYVADKLSVVTQLQLGTRPYEASFSPTGVVIADINHDGLDDILVFNYQLEVFLNEGNGSFSPPVTFLTQAGSPNILAGNLTGDDQTQVLFENNDGTISVYSPSDSS